jgi:hypothetical protein
VGNRATLDAVRVMVGGVEVPPSAPTSAPSLYSLRCVLFTTATTCSHVDKDQKLATSKACAPVDAHTPKRAVDVVPTRDKYTSPTALAPNANTAAFLLAYVSV